MSHKDYWKGKPNSEKIILDLCGGTGAWSKPYQDAGYDVRVVTHPHNDIFEFDEYKQYIDKVYGVLAAPPCTHFSLARTTAKTPRDMKTAFKAVQRCLEIVYDCRLNGKLVFWALENPRALLRQVIGKPPLTFNPSDYGDCYKKITDLWGYYTHPKKNPASGKVINFKKHSFPQLPERYVLPEGMRRDKARNSVTSKYFAEAFFRANR